MGRAKSQQARIRRFLKQNLDYRLPRCRGRSFISCIDMSCALVFSTAGRANVRFEGPLFGDEKAAAYAAAALFILPSLHENFGMVVAEALAQGTPVISTVGVPWKGLVAERCGWWVDYGPEALAVAIREDMVLRDEERAQMGARGRDCMRR